MFTHRSRSKEGVHERRWWILGVLALSLVIIGLDNTILNVALPSLQREFRASASELQWMVDAYIIVFAGLLLTFGALGDRYGRARALWIGLAIFGVASVAAAFSQSAGQLIAARAVMGVGGAFIMPATLSIIIHVFPAEERGKAISIWAGVAGLGVGLGPLAGGLLIEWFWWGSVFLINVPVVLTALVAGYALIPESRDPSAPTLDLPGAVLSLSTVTALIYAIIEAPARGWLDPLVLSGFGLAIVLGIGFVLRELATDEPMLDFGTFRNRRFSFGAGAIGISFFALFGMIFLLTQYLQFVRGYSALEAGIRLTPIALGIMIGASQSHRWVARLGTTKVVSAAMLGLAIVLGAMALWSVDTDYWVIGTMLFLLAAMMGNVMAPSTEAVMGALPEDKAGVGSAMNDLVRQIGGAFGVAVIGSVVNSAYSDEMTGTAANLPPQAAGPASDSVGAALRIASQLDGPMAEMVASASREAFVAAMGIGALLAGAVAVIGAGLVGRYLPAGDPIHGSGEAHADRGPAAWRPVERGHAGR